MSCCALEYPWAGVEYAVAYFCGAALPTSGQLPMESCNAMNCVAIPSGDQYSVMLEFMQFQ